MVVQLGAIAIVGAVYYFLQSIPPVKRFLDATVNAIWQNSLMETSQYIELYFKGHIKYNELLQYLAWYGFNQLQADNMIKISFVKLGVADVIQLHRRGDIDDTVYKARLQAAGLNPDDKELFELATKVVPSPSDLVRFAVREVYSPNFIEEYRLNEDLPDVYIKEAAKVGMSKELATNYWAAHWDLPSFTQAQDLLARGIITEDDFKLLARALDINPYWRDKMLQLAYVPFTRVDSRRMYQLGVLNEEQLKRSYQDIGYSEEKALQLVEFTKKDILTEERDFTKTELFTLYNNGEVDAQYINNKLLALGYGQDQIDLLIQLEDYKKNKASQNDLIDLLFTRYQNGTIDYQTLQDSINKLDLGAQQIDLLLAKADRVNQAQENFLTKSEINALYKSELISIEQYKEYMSRLKYPDWIIELYTKLYIKFEGF